MNIVYETGQSEATLLGWDKRFASYGFGVSPFSPKMVNRFLEDTGFRYPNADVEKILDLQRKYDVILQAEGSISVVARAKANIAALPHKISSGDAVGKEDFEPLGLATAREQVQRIASKEARRLLAKNALPHIESVLSSVRRHLRDELSAIEAAEAEECRKWEVEFSPSPKLKALAAFTCQHLEHGIKLCRSGLASTSPRAACCGLV